MVRRRHGYIFGVNVRSMNCLTSSVRCASRLIQPGTALAKKIEALGCERGGPLQEQELGRQSGARILEPSG